MTTCFLEQGLLFHDKTPFRVSPKLCYVLGGGNCILCLSALMFIWNGYVQVCLMLYSLKIIKLHDWIINFVSPLEAVPECPFQSAVLRALPYHLSIYHLIYFFYFWLCWVSAAAWAVSSCSKQGLPSVAAGVSCRGGFSCCRAQPLGCIGFSS